MEKLPNGDSYELRMLNNIEKSYKPKIIESFAKIRKTNIKTQEQEINQSFLKNQPTENYFILQEENYEVFQRPKSPIKSRTKKGQKQASLQSLLKKVGLKNQHLITQTNELIRLHNNYQQKRLINQSQSTSTNKKYSLLPQIRNIHSKSMFLNKKVKTQTSQSSHLKIKNGKSIKIKQLKQNKKSPKKSFSERRLRQDYKYLFQNDDSERFHQRSKPLYNEQKKKVKILKIKQDMLGKIVLERVQNHLKNDKCKPLNYISKIKQQKLIDEALIQFIKTKVKRADKVLQ